MTKRAAVGAGRPNPKRKQGKGAGSRPVTGDSTSDAEEGRDSDNSHAATPALPLGPRHLLSARKPAATTASDPLGPCSKQLSSEQIKRILGIANHPPQSDTDTNNKTLTPAPAPTSTPPPHNHHAYNNPSTANSTLHMQAQNTYTLQDRAPFYVVFKKEKICDILVTRMLMSCGFDGIVQTRTLSSNTVRVEFKSRETANKVACSDVINNEHLYKTVIPNDFVKTVGIVRGVPTCVTDDEISMHIKSKVPVDSFERMHYWDQNDKRLKPGTSIKITFRASDLPKQIAIFYVLKDVEYFVPKPTLCNKCLRYGHIAKWCKSNDILCTNCSESTHAFGDASCNGSCTHCKRSCAPKCRHCTANNNHRTNSSECPSMQTQTKIKTHMLKSKCSFNEAKQFILSVPEQPETYANVTRIAEVNKELLGRLQEAESLLKNMLQSMRTNFSTPTQPAPAALHQSTQQHRSEELAPPGSQQQPSIAHRTDEQPIIAQNDSQNKQPLISTILAYFNKHASFSANRPGEARQPIHSDVQSTAT